MALKKQLSLLDVFCISSGAMISSGLFVLPGIAYSYVGPAAILAYLFAGILIIPSMFSKAELSTAMPKAGGSYFFIERSMGAATGTIGGFASWFSLALKSAFALIGIGAFAVLLFPSITPIQIKLVAIGFCVLFTFLNFFSVKMTGKFQVGLVITLILVLLLYFAFGLGHLKLESYSPFMTDGLGSIFSVVGLVFISFAGLTKITSVAEEVENPKKNIPRGMFLSFFTVLLLYLLVVFVTVGVLGPGLAPPDAEPSLTPISDAARLFMGNIGLILVSIAGLFAFLSTANAGILSASRYPLAMSRDHLLPQFFGKVNKRFGTPHVSILFTGIFMICMIAFFDIENLVKAASTMQLLLFIYVNASVIIMRESKLPTYRPSYRSPLYPYIQIAAILIYIFLIVEMGALPIIITGVFTALCVLWYFIYVRFRVHRKSAIVHIVERITDRQLGGSTLSAELRGILRQRDNVIEDRFDKLVSSCEILDLEESVSAEEFFRMISKKLADKLDTDEDGLYNAFIEREQQSTTALESGLAIPHVIIEGTKKFDMIIARNKEGIIFSRDLPPVHTVFALVGTRDERNFHLRALMSIAQVVQQLDFEKRWLKARDTEELRDIILLAERTRDKNGKN
jgi:amino acid transporter/mannitol/fructose-specific phosphotransferase system IIA component (Ntr-type)